MASLHERAGSLLRDMARMTTKEYIDSSCTLIADALDEVDRLRRLIRQRG